MTIKASDFLSTGSTLLNLACSDDPHSGFRKGMYYWLVGDSDSGKTFLSMTCLAEASISKAFNDYRFIYDGKERGALMNIAKFFGSAVDERLEMIASETVEEFYYNCFDAVKAGPCIYVLDSMDVLDSVQDVAKFEEKKKAHEKGKDTTGSYGMAKAKMNSENVRKLMTPLQNTGSILIIISQTRDNVGFGFETKTVGGGRALKFYATLQLWSAPVGRLQKTVRGKKRQLGVKIQVRVRKNRQTGKDRIVDMPIYHSFGIDDVGSCVNYLVSEGEWSESKGVLNAVDFDLKGQREKIIKQIEEEDLVDDLRDIVAEVWDEIESKCVLDRKRRYD